MVLLGQVYKLMLESHLHCTVALIVDVVVTAFGILYTHKAYDLTRSGPGPPNIYIYIYIHETCAWTPNNDFYRFVCSGIIVPIAQSVSLELSIQESVAFLFSIAGSSD